jgi:O-succinylbenzoic acid--CoA ligase
VRRLVALDLPPGAAFVEAMKACFDAGDAVLPVDQRLPFAARRALFEALRPDAVVSRDGVEAHLPRAVPVEEGDAFVVATSGTMGEPKGVVLTHEAVAASGRASSARLGIEPDRDRWLCCLPVSHVGGLSVITRALVTATSLEILPRFDAREVMRVARARNVTRISLVPTALLRLTEDDVAFFRTILLGGSVPPHERAPNVVATYGMTETGSGVVYDGIPLEGVELRIADDDEIIVRAPMLLRSYRDGTDPKDAHGWLKTKDAGAIGKDGNLVVFGRMGELIISGGENVWPSAVENVLAENELIAEVVVVGLPDDKWGQRVTAFVVPARRDLPPALEDLRSLVRDALGAYAAPQELFVVDELPKTTSGKIRRGALNQKSASRTSSEPAT